MTPEKFNEMAGMFNTLEHMITECAAICEDAHYERIPDPTKDLIDRMLKITDTLSNTFLHLIPGDQNEADRRNESER